MIELSTSAKMKLAENRTTLFKADLILNGSPVDAAGKNLNDAENGYEGNFSGTIGQRTYIFWYDGYGVNFRGIPIELLSMYSHITISQRIKMNSITQPGTEARMGLYFKNGNGSSVYYLAGDMWAFPIGEYVRIYATMRTSSLISVGNPQQLIGLCLDFANTTDMVANFDYKDAMIEFNNTGDVSDYVNPYLNSGGSYDDFLTARTISLTGDDVMSGTATFSDSTSSSGSFDIGAAIINSMSLTLNNYDDRFAGIDFAGASVRAYIGVPIEPVEWITKGYYTVDKPTSIGNTIPLTMLDNMSKFEKPYKNVTQLYPATLYDIAHSICTYCGVVLNDASFPNSDFVIPARPDDTNLTCLAMISYVAQIAGCYARVNRFGYLEFKWYSIDVFESEGDSYDGGTFSYTDGDALDGGTFAYDDGDSADGGTFDYGEYYACYALSTFSVGTEDIVVSGIRVVVDFDNEVAVGADGYVLEISDNPLVTADNMATVANYLGNQLVGMKFRPFNISALSEPSVEAGDAIRITDSKGNYYDSFITTCSYKFGNYEPFACNAQTVSENEATSYSPITKAVEKARKESEKALSSYDLGVIRMNEIAMNAMGYHSSYTEELDGSRISYIHNKPLRAESTIIWKLSASGFFLSTDGGTTYVSGWDAEGNAVFNILYAIGIVCDWIKGGTLTLGGDNNVNGLARILDAGGGEVCRIDKDGLDVIAGRIGNIKINYNGLGSSNLGQSLSGLWLYDDGDFGFSKNTSRGSYSSFFSTLASGNIHFYTGMGGDTAGEGFIIENISYGESQSSVIRVGSQVVQRNYSEYAVFSPSSDRRLKKNIKTVDYGLIRKFFDRVRVVKFNYRKKKMVDDKIAYFGVIAQEIKEVLEDIGCSDTNIVETNEQGYFHVNYEKLHGFELAAIKDLYEKSDEQQAEIDDLKNTVSKQQAEIDELKEQMKYLIQKVGGI